MMLDMLNAELYTNECWFASAMYMNDYASYCVLCFKLYIPVFLCMIMFMGLVSCMLVRSSVLLPNRRDKDVTKWYQSPGSTMGLNGP